MVLTLCYINFLSYDVTSNLHELKDCISEAEISNEKWQAITIQRINSFEGFDAHGFFTLGRPHLTSVVANFITYIIVLIQFKQSEDTESKNKWWRTSKLYHHTSIIVSIIQLTFKNFPNCDYNVRLKLNNVIGTLIHFLVVTISATYFWKLHLVSEFREKENEWTEKEY